MSHPIDNTARRIIEHHTPQNRVQVLRPKRISNPLTGQSHVSGPTDIAGLSKLAEKQKETRK